MIVAVAIVVALACAAASTRRLWLLANATYVHPGEVAAALGKKPDEQTIARLREALAGAPGADWERDLFEALDAPEPKRAALVNEQLTELDWRLQRWSGVPAICARISTSFGFLLGALVLRDALSYPGEITEMVTYGVIGRAIGVVVTGVAGTLFCVAAHKMARTMAKERLVATDAMVEALEGARAASPAAP